MGKGGHRDRKHAPSMASVCAAARGQRQEEAARRRPPSCVSAAPPGVVVSKSVANVVRLKRRARHLRGAPSVTDRDPFYRLTMLSLDHVEGAT
jgi:hypothetical protein